MSREGKILIVDDNKELLIALKIYLSPHYDLIETIRTPNQIPSQLESINYDLVLLDMNFKAGDTSGNEGFYWMNRILETDPQISIIFITAFGDTELAIRALKEGATDFILKSWDDKKILSTIQSAYKLRKSRLEIRHLKLKQKHLNSDLQNEHLVCTGIADSMKSVYDMIERVSDTDANILILGENGTGKEIIARQVHQLSRRKDELFVIVDLGSLNENLFESELFGYTRGAFTDAREDKQGRFELADKGTLYLDEIGNIPVSLQSKLLSAIQSREIYRLGASKPIPVDIRLICSTNKAIYEMVEHGEFREDLLYRINTIQVDLPPLRERVNDIPILTDFFIEKYAAKYRKGKLTVSPTAIEKLKKHSWNGNVRELEHSIEKAVILAKSDHLNSADFLLHTRASEGNYPDSFNLEENEKRIINRALQQFGGKISITAKSLGINRSTLYDKIKKYDL